MTAEQASRPRALRYAADEDPPHPFSFVVGLHVALIVCVSVVVVTAVVARAANQGDAYLSWAVSASMVIGGLLTIVQTKRIGRIGAGTVTVMGPAGASIGVAALALVAGGPPLLGALVVASALFQYVIAARLALLRRIVTPVVSGALICLVALSVVPLGFAMLTRVPEGAPPAAAPVIATVTALTVVGLMLRAPRRVRVWSAVLGIFAGCLAAAGFGVVDFGRVAGASWIGLPPVESLGLDFSFGPAFWGLLPAFLLVSFTLTVRLVSETVLMHRVSHREPRAVDFRRVQGAVAASGTGTVLAGFAGVLPPGPYGVGSVMAERAGVAARRVGAYVGAIFVALAFMPKIAALVLAIPLPVLGSYIIVVFSHSLARGLRIVFREGIGERDSLVFGLALLLAAGIQFQAIFPSYLATPTARMFANGLTVGGFTILLLNLFLALTGPRRHRAEMPLKPDSQPGLDRFLGDFATRYAWGSKATDRLRAASEEALLSLVRQEDEHTAEASERRLRIVARKTRSGALLEFTAATQAGNLENQIMLLGDRPDPRSHRDLSLALLRHYASSVTHQQFHNVDILTVRVDRD